MCFILYLHCVHKQVYLLTPIDRATLVYAKSTISHCPPSLIPGNERRLIANCYRDREMSVITTYLNNNAQNHLVYFLSVRYTTNFATNTMTDRTDWAYALVYGSTNVDRRRWDKQWSVVDLIDPS